MDKLGFLTVAYGERAHDQARLLARSVQRYTLCNIAVITNVKTDYAQSVYHNDYDIGARWAKLNMNRLTPFERTIYMDADTVLQADITPEVDALLNSFDLLIAPSTAQDDRAFQHIDNAEEKRATFAGLFNWWPLQLQAGVMAFRKCNAIDRLFAFWRCEWLRYQEQDQMALLRALDSLPTKPKLWLLSSEFNGGALVKHNFGRARRV